MIIFTWSKNFLCVCMERKKVLFNWNKMLTCLFYILHFFLYTSNIYFSYSGRFSYRFSIVLFVCLLAFFLQIDFDICHTLFQDIFCRFLLLFTLLVLLLILLLIVFLYSFLYYPHTLILFLTFLTKLPKKNWILTRVTALESSF